MCIRILSGKSSVAIALTSLALFVGSARAQAPQSQPSRLESEVTEMRAENVAMREQLRKLEEQQKSIDEQQKYLAALIGELQRLLGRGTATNVAIDGKPIVPSTTANASAPRANAALNTRPAVTGSASTPVPPASGATPPSTVGG